MGFLVSSGASITCSFGAAPSTLMVLPMNRVISKMPLANIMDNKPMANILPFGTCKSMANPTVAAASIAAKQLVQMPCIPVTIAPWAPGSPTVLISNMPALNNTSKLMCAWAGVIQITSAGQFKIMVP
ncbi:MAG: DUF4280 domain-containing protein [Firmicutes bacterium]|nr:DUF4280 domain-containing protein [Bacillota bacterium]